MQQNMTFSIVVIMHGITLYTEVSLMLISFQINHQPDATIFQFIILTFIYSSTCFGRFPAHHQELNDCSGSIWFYLRVCGDSRALFVVGPTGLTD
jgi:hypothetical protein